MLATVSKTMTVTDRIIAAAMQVGLALALVEYGRLMALPAHFV